MTTILLSRSTHNRFGEDEPDIDDDVYTALRDELDHGSTYYHFVTDSQKNGTPILSKDEQFEYGKRIDSSRAHFIKHASTVPVILDKLSIIYEKHVHSKYVQDKLITREKEGSNNDWVKATRLVISRQCKNLAERLRTKGSGVKEGGAHFSYKQPLSELYKDLPLKRVHQKELIEFLEQKTPEECGVSSVAYKAAIAGMKAAHKSMVSDQNTLVESVMPLVVSTKKKYLHIGEKYPAISFQDTIQATNETVTNLVERWDHRTGVKFSAFVFNRLEYPLLNYMNKESRLLRLSRGDSRRVSELKKELSKAKDPDEFLSKLPIKDIELLNIDQGGVLLDDAYMPPHRDEMIDSLSNMEELKRTKQALLKLKPREQRIIELRHLHDTKITLEEIGKELGVSGERIRQIESEALQKLKEELNPEGVKKAPKKVKNKRVRVRKKPKLQVVPNKPTSDVPERPKPIPDAALAVAATHV